jgi:hypothetical protein
MRRITLLVVVVALAIPVWSTPAPVLASTSLAESLGLPEEMIPVDFGQTTLEVYVSATGHTISGTMLDYWRANGASSVYGNPISEVFAGTNGFFSQAFERGILQYNPSWTLTDNPTVRLQPIGRQQITHRATTTRADGRRTTGDRRLSAWQPGSQQEARATEVYNQGGRFSDITGYSIAGEFERWYDGHEGWFYVGAPISEPMRERGTTIQYFENTILISTEDGVRPVPLPIEHPERYGIDITPVNRRGQPEFSEALFINRPNPYGVDVTVVPGRKYIVVDLSEQTLYAYQGDQVILQTLVSTGVEPNSTEIGFFRVRIKYAMKDMTGVTDGSGAVTSVGTAAEGQSGSEYLVPDVPDVMFINYEAEALHGAYWHNDFGQRRSHGCINLPLDVSGFLFDWAPLGTAVTVIE